MSELRHVSIYIDHLQGVTEHQQQQKHLLLLLFTVIEFSLGGIIIIIIIRNDLAKYVGNIPGSHEVRELQKTAILGTAHILRKVLT